MFKQFFEEFWPKVVDYVAEQGLNNVLNIKDFKHNLKTLHKNLKLLSAAAFDVEKEIKNGEDSGRKKRKREVEEWLGDVKSTEVKVDELGSQAGLKEFFMKFLDGGKASQLNEQVEKLLQQRQNFGEPVLDARGSRGEMLLTDELVGEAFKENLETILKILEDREVSKIGVYGMGGVGKTTLAKHVYNRLVQEYEGCVVWVTVSHEFTIKSLQDKIARFLGVELSNEDEEAIKASRLNSFLSQKKISVLILDDVWEKIDMKKVGCTFSAECCRLIITTRSLEVCRQIGCKKLIPVVKLGKDEALKLFNETLENDIDLGLQVKKIVKSMAELCGGLPLGIITVAGSMKGETTIHKWQTSLAELKDCVEGQDDTGEVDEVFKVLKYSFDRLNKNDESGSNEFNRFQLCFMYCSLYPEDCKIDREGLLRKFMSERLLDERKSWRAQIVQGHSILDKLVNLCLLEKCVDDIGRKCVKMHDLVRSMALKICKGKYMVRAGDWSLEEFPNDEEWTKDLEKVSFMQCRVCSIKEGLSPDCPKLSTLLLWENPWLEVIPDSFFFKMQGLCTLDLCNTRIRMLPDSISDLKSLKALLLEDCLKLEKLPYLGNMKALRELNLSRTAITEAPQGLENLLKLEFLSLGGACGLTMIPRKLLQRLVCLQHVSIPFHLQAPMEGIQNLRLLEEFNGSVDYVEDFNCFIRNGERRRERDTWYTITIVGGKYHEGKVPCSFEPSCYKKKLGLIRCNLKDKRVSGQDTEYLIITECKNLSISFLDGFSGLKILSMSRCEEIEWILRSDGQGSQFSNTLEEIQLWQLDDVKGLVMERWGIGPSTIAPSQPIMFSSLRRLKIQKCKKMRKLGLPAQAIPNVESIYIEDCDEMEEILEEDEQRVASMVPILTLPKLQRLYLCELPRLRKVGLPVSGVPNLEYIYIEWCAQIEEIFEEEEDEERTASTMTTLAKLRELNLYGLSKLKCVSKATIICNSIQTICIRKCPILKNKLPLHMDDPLPPSLREIRVEREWWESLEWGFNPNLPLLLNRFIWWNRMM